MTKVIASFHLADVGVGATLRRIWRRPSAHRVDGLRRADLAVASPMRTTGAPRPDPRRLALVAFWDEEHALDRFLDEHPLAHELADGWRARLEPLRAFGTWPGLPDDIARSRTTAYEGPAVVLTLGRLRLSQAPRFLRTSRPAEAAAVEAPGAIWVTALARPPFVATCSLWESTSALSAYAYGDGGPAHPDAIAADRANGFHHESAFIRFRPLRVEGQLAGRNPLPPEALPVVAGPG